MFTTRGSYIYVWLTGRVKMSWLGFSLCWTLREFLRLAQLRRFFLTEFLIAPLQNAIQFPSDSFCGIICRDSFDDQHDLVSGIFRFFIHLMLGVNISDQCDQ